MNRIGWLADSFARSCETSRTVCRECVLTPDGGVTGQGQVVSSSAVPISRMLPWSCPSTQSFFAAQQQCPSATQHSIEHTSDCCATNAAGAATQLNKKINSVPAAFRLIFLSALWNFRKCMVVGRSILRLRPFAKLPNFSERFLSTRRSLWRCG